MISAPDRTPWQTAPAVDAEQTRLPPQCQPLANCKCEPNIHFGRESDRNDLFDNLIGQEGMAGTREDRLAAMNRPSKPIETVPLYLLKATTPPQSESAADIARWKSDGDLHLCPISNISGYRRNVRGRPLGHGPSRPSLQRRLGQCQGKRSPWLQAGIH